MPPKKRATRTVPKPTIMLEPSFPPDLPAPTTTRNRQPRAQATSRLRSVRPSTLDAQKSALHTSEAPRVMEAAHSRTEIMGGSSPPPANDHQDLEMDAGEPGASVYGESMEYDGGNLVNASSGPSSAGIALTEDAEVSSNIYEDDYPTHIGASGPSSSRTWAETADSGGQSSAIPSAKPLSTDMALVENADSEQAGYSAPAGASGSSSTHTWAPIAAPQPPGDPSSTIASGEPLSSDIAFEGPPSTTDAEPSEGPSTTSHIAGAKRKRSPSVPPNDADQEPVMKVDKGKGKARAVDDNVMEISDSPPKPPPSSQDMVEKPFTNKGKGKGKARAMTPEDVLEISDSPVKADRPPSPPPLNKLSSGQPLSEYTCPICFGPPSNATLTPCGHICCGPCLFAAVKTTMSRAAFMGPFGSDGRPEARCPVCRAVIPRWDGRGGGVIGLKIRTQLNV